MATAGWRHSFHELSSWTPAVNFWPGKSLVGVWVSGGRASVLALGSKGEARVREDFPPFIKSWARAVCKQTHKAVTSTDHNTHSFPLALDSNGSFRIKIDSCWALILSSFLYRNQRVPLCLMCTGSVSQGHYVILIGPGPAWLWGQRIGFSLEISHVIWFVNHSVNLLTRRSYVASQKDV